MTFYCHSNQSFTANMLMMYLTKVNMKNILFERSNNYYPKGRLTIELNRKSFLDTKLIGINAVCNTIVNRK